MIPRNRSPGEEWQRKRPVRAVPIGCPDEED
jgi:hypothetical protein